MSFGDPSFYQKPVNPKYQEFIMHDRALAAKERNTALYKPQELKNFDLKTDGQPISYKPEYHPSSLMSNIFPSPSLPGVKPTDPVQIRTSRVRTALEHRKKAKLDNVSTITFTIIQLRKTRLRNVLQAEI